MEHLLEPRFKVIAGYPGTLWSVGAIIEYCITTETPEDFTAYYQQWPHLFKRLAWYEERRLHNLPAFVKFTDGKVCNVEGYGNTAGGTLHVMFLHEGKLRSRPVRMCVPATEQEYNDYLKSTKTQ